jgi:hypothetical protein
MLKRISVIFMKNRRGEIATLLTLGLVLIGTAVTIATSFITNNQKNIASNPKADVANCTFSSASSCSLAVKTGECPQTTGVCAKCANNYYRCPGTSDNSGSGSVTKTQMTCTGSSKLYWKGSDGKYYASATSTTGYASITSVCGSASSCVGTASYEPCKDIDAGYTGGYYANSGKFYEDNQCKKQITIGPGTFCKNKNPSAAAPGGEEPTTPGGQTQPEGNSPLTPDRLCCKLYNCGQYGAPAGQRQVKVVGFTGVREDGTTGYTSCATTGYTNVQQCSTVPGAPTSNGATGYVSCDPGGGVDPGGVDPGTGGGGQGGGSTTGPGGVGYCCLVYKQGLYASQYGCGPTDFAAKVVGFTGVKENGTAGYTSCATTGYEKYSGTYKVGDCSSIAGAESLAAAGAGSACIADPDSPPYIEPEIPAGPDEGTLGGPCKKVFEPLNFSFAYKCDGSLVCSSQSDSGICQNPSRVDTCTPQNSKNDGNTYGCFSDLYSDPSKSCKNISGQPNVYTSASGFTCKQSYQVCCKKQTSGSGAPTTNQCSALANCPGSTTKKYVTGVQTNAGASLTQFYPDVASCNSRTGGKNAITDVCGTSGANPPGIPPAGGNPVQQPYTPQGTCKTTLRVLHFGTDCSYDEFANASQSCSNTTPVSGVSGTGCTIFRVCPPKAIFGGDSCKYDCYQNNKKYNCGGTDTEYGRNNDANRLYDVIHVSNKTNSPVEIYDAKVIKHRVGAEQPHKLSAVTLAPGQYTTYDLNVEGFTCNNVSLNSMEAILNYRIKSPAGDILGEMTGQDGCGGGVKILLNITQ